MIVYRISSTQYANDLSGIGAGLYGGRWNPRGMNLLYTAGSISLACLEYLAHNFHVMQTNSLCLSKIEVSEDSSIQEITSNDLPKNWNEHSYEPFSTQQIGLDFSAQTQYYGLKVPSAIVPEEFNYLLNPLHGLHKETIIKEQITPFQMDRRLFGK